MNAEENARLTLTGPGTPCGEMMRRYWIPVGISDELTYLPKPVLILGEDLVLFRDGRGRPGLLGKHCSHRGTSLEYGQVDEEGIRCCYHGWLYDVEGRVLDMPAEPPESTAKDHLRHLAYPCRELGGLIFAYMGPREKMPELPGYEFLVREDGTRVAQASVRACNWLQSIENVGDPVHTAFLHAIPGQRNVHPMHFDIPRFETERTGGGMMVHQMRSAYHKRDWLFLPMLQVNVAKLSDRNAEPEPGEEEVGTYASWAVPVDDTRHWDLLVTFVPFDKDGKPRQRRHTNRTAHHGMIQSYEESQRGPRDLEAQVGQGPIGRREDWNLVSSDAGVLMFENLIGEAIDAVEQGNDPLGVIRDPERARFVEAKPRLIYEAPTLPLEPWRTQGLRAWSKRVGPASVYEGD